MAKTIVEISDYIWTVDMFLPLTVFNYYFDDVSSLVALEIVFVFPSLHPVSPRCQAFSRQFRSG